MLAAWGDAKRFPDGDHAASYLGLAPCTKQSAEHCYHGPITKRGNALARWMLIEAAQHLDKHPGPLGNFFRRLARKKNRNVAVVAAARKLAVIGWQMLTSGEPYRYAIPRSTEAKLAKLRGQATGRRPVVFRQPGQKRLSLLPLRLGRKPTGPLGGSHPTTALSGGHRAVRETPPPDPPLVPLSRRPEKYRDPQLTQTEVLDGDVLCIDGHTVYELSYTTASSPPNPSRLV
jgi:hypothetical protein